MKSISSRSRGFYAVILPLLIAMWLGLPAPRACAGDDFKEFLKAEKRTRAIAERVIAPTVCVILPRGGSGSGVIVQKDGLVLTAAHVIGSPGTMVSLLLSNGRCVQGKALGLDHQTDTGMIQILEKGDWPVAEIGLASGLQAGEWCIATGHPGGPFRGRRPPLRLGRVLSYAQGENICTDAAGTPGDSGGPLFDLEGKVVGIWSSVDLDVSKNFCVPVDVYCRQWNDLVKGKEIGGQGGDSRWNLSTRWGRWLSPQLLVGNPWLRCWNQRCASAPPRRPPDDNDPDSEDPYSEGILQYSKYNRKFLARLAGVTGRYAKSMATVLCSKSEEGEDGEDSEAVAWATVIRKDGYLLTKASELKGRIVCRLGEREYPAKIVQRDEEHDVALLRVEANDLTPIAWASGKEPAVGSWLITPNVAGKALSLGILAHSSRVIHDPTIPRERGNQAVMGAFFASKVEAPTVTYVEPFGPAFKAGLQVGDVIVAIDGTPMRDKDGLFAKLKSYEADTKVIIDVKRAGKELRLPVTLVDTGALPKRSAGTDGVSDASASLSKHSYGFPRAMTHDMHIQAQECGGPILDLKGRCVGLNIARASRSETYALCADVLRQLVDTWLDKSK